MNELKRRMYLCSMLDLIILNALAEDIGEGDHSTLACVPEKAIGAARLLVKEEGIIAGIEVAKRIYELVDPTLELIVYKHDGEQVKIGDIAFVVTGSSRSILTSERLVLNFMQRMSGIATQTNQILRVIEGCNTKLLDTRKLLLEFVTWKNGQLKLGEGKTIDLVFMI